MYITPIKRKYFIAMLIFAFCVLLIASTHEYMLKEQYTSALRQELVQEKTKLTSLATTLSNDDVDDATKAVVTDCNAADRAQFDSLLGSLSQLHGADLAKLQQLFNECSSYYPVREAMMSQKLEREFEIYSDFVTILSTADAKVKKEDYALDSWGSLVSMEQQRSDLAIKLTSLQGQIIAALRANASVGSDQIRTLLSSAQQAKGDLSLISTQLQQVRKVTLTP